MPRFFALSMLFLAGVCSASNAALVHRYSFSGNVNDSIGTAHGTIVDPGTVNHAFAGGKLDVQTNRGLPYPQNADGAFVELPGNIFSAAFLGGVAGEITIEMWVEVAALTPWASPFNFGYAAPDRYLQVFGEFLEQPRDGRRR
ncbi:hypothetical protein [Lacipirellula parvula]|uniref:Uncharacterized protein n=1 Tax=Lacipirellula parvula TaxID=2650471 RepID=A0A5K7XI74_9BACT|nr:hypothetical protein [Lacipirellula parvula]BBO33903.1 hypothetical protein PLANPX_3515 [Lacipirellula parvula]